MASNTKSKLQHLEHGFPACFDAESKVLILGSFPSVKSRAISFYYGHPQNRFWPLMSTIFGRECGNSVDEKRIFLHDVHLALYDVIDSCDIVGSSDASIKNAVPTDINSIMKQTKIERILLNGATAGKLFIKHQLPLLDKDVPYLILPSTSPANAACSKEELLRIWGKALS